MQAMGRLLLALELMMATSVPVVAQGPPAEKPAAVVADLVVVTATVEAIDHAKRRVTLKGPEGRTKTIKVGEAVKNLDQVKKGDQVTAEYFEETAIFVRTAQEQPTAREAALVEVAPRAAKPGLAAVDTVEVTAKVDAIDYQKRTVMLRGPQGDSLTLKVDERAKKFDQVKTGDEVVVRHTEAVAVTVGKP
jgi:hypothetical protein